MLFVRLSISSSATAAAASHAAAFFAFFLSGAQNDVGIIVGGVLAGLVIVCITIVAVVWIIKRSAKPKPPRDTTVAIDVDKI